MEFELRERAIAALAPDGGLFDIVVEETRWAERDALLAALPTLAYPLRWSLDREKHPGFSSAREAWSRSSEAGAMLEINLARILAHTVLSPEEVIELGIDPREIRESDFCELTEFLSRVGISCNGG